MPAADQDHRHRLAVRLHLVDRVLDALVNRVEHRLDHLLVEVRDLPRVADHGLSRAHGDVGRRELAAAEHERAFAELVADRIGTEPRLVAVEAHERAAAERDRQHVGHPEVRAHAAGQVRGRGLAREAAHEEAEVAGRAADVDHDRVLHAGQERGTADAVGRSRRARDDREPRRIVGRDQRAVVLAQVNRRRDAELRECLAQRAHDVARQPAQRRIDQRRVLAIDQPEPADLARQRDVGVGMDARQHGRGLLLDIGTHRREVRRDRDRADALLPDVARGRSPDRRRRARHTPCRRRTSRHRRGSARPAPPTSGRRATRPSAECRPSSAARPAPRRSARGCLRCTNALMNCVVPTITLRRSCGRCRPLRAPNSRRSRRRRRPVAS